ncbi:MAG: peptide chain release factor-like protein [Candidatus Didemnitutus sp.]|nr:peptide chain release factor-like protein [Candidatus Didemnitutus sp.]
MSEWPDCVAEDLAVRLERIGSRAADFEERFVRGAGAGGQKINKTSSTVCVSHRPSGTEVRCQRERSQAQNRRFAWEEITAKLEQLSVAPARAAQAARELSRRQKRQKSRGQKARMIAGKKHRARIRGARRGGADGW